MSCLVLLAPGLALTIEALARRPLVLSAWSLSDSWRGTSSWSRSTASACCAPGEAVSFGQIVRQQGELATRSPFFYPFAFPANAWFAWRNGLPIERYDLLGPEPLRPSLEIVFDASSNKYLMDGWGPRAGDEWGELRWIDGATAELVAPLDPAGNVPIDLQIEWRARLVDPPSAAGVTDVRQRREARDRVSRTRRTGRVVLGIARAFTSGDEASIGLCSRRQRLAARLGSTDFRCGQVR